MLIGMHWNVQSHSFTVRISVRTKGSLSFNFSVPNIFNLLLVSPHPHICEICGLTTQHLLTRTMHSAQCSAQSPQESLQSWYFLYVDTLAAVCLWSFVYSSVAESNQSDHFNTPSPMLDRFWEWVVGTWQVPSSNALFLFDASSAQSVAAAVHNCTKFLFFLEIEI